MRNVEIKAHVRNISQICQLAESLSCGPPEIIKQDDTFYRVNSGRLKMRFYDDNSATLVRYDRNDEKEAKLSNYDLLHFSVDEANKAQELAKILKQSLGIHGHVVKQRKLYMVDQTRIHIDTVQNLGDFMELEVVLRPEQSVEEGQAIAKHLQKELNVEDSDLIDCAYMDLLNKKH